MLLFPPLQQSHHNISVGGSCIYPSPRHETAVATALVSDALFSQYLVCNCMADYIQQAADMWEHLESALAEH